MGKRAVFESELPECCRECKHRDSDCDGDYQPLYYFCTKNLFMPTKKKTCKKQEKYE